jgi:hypothetical protein
MIKTIENNRQPCVDVYAGKDAFELVLAMYKSQKKGKSMELLLDSFLW